MVMKGHVIKPEKILNHLDSIEGRVGLPIKFQDLCKSNLDSIEGKYMENYGNIMKYDCFKNI